ncbi:extracellular solute-binding protein [Mesorhizobium sp.]|uniref:extracellular solute-binding protein n=1 Tax=Mesorhizobium sp. TaxID=1871066 RepID=UPI0025C4B7BD|nr:extracellular solute-binding protein [Mesorhizobium sp.]
MKANMFLSTPSLAAITAAAFVIGGISAAAAGGAAVADPNAKVDYSGTVSVLTKFGLQQLSPFFVDAAKKYEGLHPGVKVELIQESDDSVKGKTKALVASNSLPDVYFTWTGSWGENFVRGKRAVDLTPVIGPDTEWGKTLATAAVSAFQTMASSTAFRFISTPSSWATTRACSRRPVLPSPRPSMTC